MSLAVALLFLAASLPFVLRPLIRAEVAAAPRMRAARPGQTLGEIAKLRRQLADGSLSPEAAATRLAELGAELEREAREGSRR